MNLFFEKMPGGNFGDDMNQWFWDAVIPGWKECDEKLVMFGIGTIINEGNFSKHKNILVMGSGIGYGNMPKTRMDRNIEYAWVRGPKTAKLLGIDKRMAITDPAILTPRFVKASNIKIRRPIFVPHATTAKLPIKWTELCDSVGIDYVSPKDDSIAVIEKIRDAEYVIAESMHAAIIADAFRVPWTPVAISNQFNNFKWDDWALSLNLNIDAYDMLSFPKEIYTKIKGFSLLKNKIISFKKSKISQNELIVNEGDGIDCREKSDNESIKKIINKYEILFEYLIKKGLQKSKSKIKIISDDTTFEARVGLIDERVFSIKEKYNIGKY